MNAYEPYEAAFDSANEHAELTVEYIKQYAEGAFDLYVSDETAAAILECANQYQDNGTNDLFQMVEKPLKSMEL